MDLKFHINLFSQEKKNYIQFVFLQVFPDWMDVPVVTERMVSPALALVQMASQELQAHQVNQAHLALLALTEKKVLKVNPEFQAPLALQVLLLLQFFHLLQFLQLLVQLTRANQHQRLPRSQ